MIRIHKKVFFPILFQSLFYFVTNHIYAKPESSQKKQKKKYIDPDEREDNSPPTYTWSSEKEKIFEKYIKDPYGPKTTKYISFYDLKYNTEVIYSNVSPPPLLEMHKFTLNEKYRYKLQYLTVDGAAVRKIYYDPPNHIGSTLGFDHFKLYGIKNNYLKFYDTKSPYTTIYILPLKKHSIVNLEYSQNIVENFNIGAAFYYKSCAIPYDRFSETKYMMSRNWDLYFHYKSEDNRYHITTSYISMKHYHKEIYMFPESTFKWKNDKIEHSPLPLKTINLEFPNNGKSKLYPDGWGGAESSKNAEFRNIINIYQQYQIYDDMQFYHHLTWFNKKNTFGGKDSDEMRDDDPKKIESERSISLHNLSNEFGYKITFFDKLFGMTYYRRGDVFRKNNHLKLEKKFILKTPEFGKSKKIRSQKIFKHVGENYIGCLLRYSDKELGRLIEGSTEYLLFKNFKYQALYSEKWFDVSFTHSKKKIPFIYESFLIYSGGPGKNDDIDRVLKDVHFITKENAQLAPTFPIKFPNPLFLELQGSLKFKFQNLYLKPSVKLDFMGEKYQNLRSFICPILQIDINFANFYIDNELTFAFNLKNPNNISGKFNQGMPLLLLYSSFYYMNSFFKDKLEFLIGIDLIYKTKYNAPLWYEFSYYTFAENELYTASDTKKKPIKIGGQPILNLFLTLRYAHFAIFGKITHINQGFPYWGYYTTNRYQGQSRSYDFGISWYFFD